MPPPTLPTLASIFNALSNLTPGSHTPSRETRPSSNLCLHPQNPARSLLHTLSPTDTEKARSIFLTLHVLFPHELLPALDLLDRRLVTRLTIRSPVSDAHDQNEAAKWFASSHSATQALPNQPVRNAELFYIQSSSASEKSSSSRYVHRKATTSTRSAFYEVRLDSWNCSCPAFSVSAFQGLNLDHSSADEDSAVADEQSEPGMSRENAEGNGEWAFGGTATLANTSAPVPSCKHILAAVLVRAAPDLFGNGVSDTTVSREEAVGWGGGWGELADG